LFDDCAFAGKEPYLGVQDAPIPGVHNSGWTPSPGLSIAEAPEKAQSLCDYVKAIVAAFKDSAQVVIWDLYNEPYGNGCGERSLPLLKKAFEWAREVGPVQPLTAGIWDHSVNAFDFGFAELSDVISFHDYQTYEQTEKLIQTLKPYNRPIYCTEWLCRQNGNAFESHLPLFGREISGAYHWGLIKGKTQTNLHGNTLTGAPDAYPGVWQHDLFYPDGRPYSEAEIAYIARFNVEIPKSAEMR